MEQTPGFEPESPDRKSGIIPHYTTLAKANNFNLLDFYLFLLFLFLEIDFEVSGFKIPLLGLKIILSVSLNIFSTFCFFALQLLHFFVSLNKSLQSSEPA